MWGNCDRRSIIGCGREAIPLVLICDVSVCTDDDDGLFDSPDTLRDGRGAGRGDCRFPFLNISKVVRSPMVSNSSSSSASSSQFSTFLSSVTLCLRNSATLFLETSALASLGWRI